MARSRSLPTTLFDDPKFFDLNSDAQVILIGLILHADDHGRGLAHIGLLSRKLGKAEALIEETLTVLEQHKLLIRYQDEEGCYYALPRWQEWETLSKPARSKYPEPPQSNTMTPSPHVPEIPQNPQGNLGDFGGFLGNSGKGRNSTLEEEEEEEREEEEEGEGEEEYLPPITFLSPSGDGGVIAVAQEQVTQVTKQAARILKLAKSAALARVVAEYLATPNLSVLGEADAAREWIDDPQRNQRHQHMTPAFFRRWLKREQAALQQQQAKLTQQQATGTDCPASSQGTPTQAATPPARSGPAGRSLMDLEARYRAEQAQAGRKK